MTPLQTKIEEWKKIAGEATDGVWTFDHECDFIFNNENQIIAEIRGFGANLPMNENGRHIATFNPETVGRLLRALNFCVSGMSAAIDGHCFLIGKQYEAKKIIEEFDKELLQILEGET